MYNSSKEIAIIILIRTIRKRKVEVINKKYKWINISTMLIILFSMTVANTKTAHAGDFIEGGTLPAGKIVDDDVFISSTNINLAGKVNGDVFAIGNTINISGEVSGSVFLIGEEITLNAPISGTVYVVSRSLKLDKDSSNDKNLYFIGLAITTEEGSTIGRDLVALALSAKLAGELGRDMKAVVGILQFFNIFSGEIEKQLPAPTPSEEPLSEDKENSQSHQISNQFISLNFSQSNPLQINTFNSTNKEDTAESQYQAIIDWLLDRLYYFITLLIIGLLVIWKFTPQLNQWSSAIKEKPWQSTGFGFLGIILAINIFAVGFLVALVIIAIGFGLGFANLWNLAYLVWGIGLSCLVLALFIFATFFIYVSKVIFAYLVSYLLLKMISPNTKQPIVLVLTLGLLIYVLVAGIPYFGWVIEIVATALGLGGVWVTYLIHKEEKHFEEVKKEISAQENSEV